jgi:hypothetical protein
MSAAPIHAVIVVLHAGGLTWYVKRSDLMGNYPGVWSLPSRQYDPATFTDAHDLRRAQEIVDALSAERLGGVDLRVSRFLTEGTSGMNPMDVDVTLRLYKVELAPEPVLNPAFYVASEWMSPVRYQEASAGQPCGLCLRLWSDYAWATGLSERPFIPTPDPSSHDPSGKSENREGEGATA